MDTKFLYLVLFRRIFFAAVERGKWANAWILLSTGRSTGRVSRESCKPHGYGSKAGRLSRSNKTVSYWYHKGSFRQEWYLYSNMFLIRIFEEFPTVTFHSYLISGPWENRTFIGGEWSSGKRTEKWEGKEFGLGAKSGMDGWRTGRIARECRVAGQWNSWRW